jgi:nucleoside-diphosphate-sugar epimerase
MYTVIGARGFIGTHLVKHLIARGKTPYTPARDNAGIFAKPLGRVIFCAGLTADFQARPFDTVEAHVSLFAKLLKEAHYESVTYLSSTRLYDSGSASIAREGDTLPLNPNEPRHLYDLSKALAENLCITAGKPNVRAARLACVYADDLSAELFLHRVIWATRKVRHARFEVAPDAARDYVHMDDVIAALLAIAERGRRPIYNVASGSNMTNADLFKLIRRIDGCQLEATLPPAGRSDPVIDIAALKADFGLQPRTLETYLPTLLGRGTKAAGIA